MTQELQLPFHDDEMALQARLGIDSQFARRVASFIRPAMPWQHREFFSELPFIIVGVVDKQGYPWVMPLFGEEGFVSSPTETRLKVDALPELTNVLDLDFSNGQKIGMLGIQLHTRRRNRMNGVIGDVNDQGFVITVDQSFGNCPQYIQTRQMNWKPNTAKRAELDDVQMLSVISEEVQQSIERADTFFIASRTKAFSQDVRSGIDASHRGGNPGFVRVEGNKLYFPDFSGNRFFNTLGNIESDGRVGLFFPEFSTGHAVFVSGRAKTLWEHDAIQQIEGAERIIEVEVERVLPIKNFMAMTGDLIDLSPSLSVTGTWDKVSRTCRNGYEPFQIVRKEKESNQITSFYLAPLSDTGIQNYIPGQFLPIQLSIAEEDTNALRSYTLSQAPSADTYRISVKREERGLVSRNLHDRLNVGSIINAGQPSGQFTLQDNDHAIVFISGGVGITPMMAMLQGLIREVENGAEPRPVWFVHGTQNSATQAFADELKQMSKKYNWLTVHAVYSKPLVDDVVGITHQSNGRVSLELLKQTLPFDHYDFYLCGSEGFMRNIYAGLVNTGVLKANIYYEFFGEGSIEEDSDFVSNMPAEKAQVSFAESGITAEWNQGDGSLLDYAEKLGLAPEFSCRMGNCGACSCKLSSGEVSYARKPGFTPAEGEVLLCSAVPAAGSEKVVIDI